MKKGKWYALRLTKRHMCAIKGLEGCLLNATEMEATL